MDERAISQTGEDWTDGSRGNLQAERRPRRKQITARRQEGRGRVSVADQAKRTSSRRAAIAVEYDQER